MRKRTQRAAAVVLAITAFGSPAGATAPGPAGKLALESRLANPDGKTQISLPAPDGAVNPYAVTADGREIVFDHSVVHYNRLTGYNILEHRLMRVGVDGSDPMPITDLALDLYTAVPAVSPDGSLVAFLDGADLAVVGIDGSNRRDLVPGPGGDEGSPAFSPDGTRIAFVRGLGTPDADLWRINTDGTGLVRLTSEPEPAFATTPDYSPDGTRLVFSRGVTGDNRDGDIYSIAVDGSDRRQLTSNPSLDEVRPRFAPDGSGIAYTGWDRFGDAQVWAMSPDGTDQHQLTRTVSELFQWTSIPPSEPSRCAGRTADVVAVIPGEVVFLPGNGDDVVAGGRGPQTIKSDYGSDTVCGGPGNDRLRGGLDNDRLYGQAGRDTVEGNEGRDLCVGGPGRDRARRCERTRSVP